jgi:hypothetical protein
MLESGMTDMPIKAAEGSRTELHSAAPRDSRDLRRAAWYLELMSSMILQCICSTHTESESLLTSLSTLRFGAFKTSATTSSRASSRSAMP